VSQIAPLISALMMMTVLSYPEHVWGQDHPTSPIPGPGELSFTTDPIIGTPSEPQCQLQPDITGVHLQDYEAWCWAASTHMVIRFLEVASTLRQCDVAYNTVKSLGIVDEYERAHPDVEIDCCRVTDQAIGSQNQTDPVIIGSKTVCHRNSRAKFALRANGYVTDGGQNRFQIVEWNPYETVPEGVPWSDLKGQICMNRPFISVKLWEGGGTHSEVVTGYRLDPDGTVVLDSHSLLGVHTKSYDDYLREPGLTVGRVRDYYDIGL
jgi:hypothetical protein